MLSVTWNPRLFSSTLVVGKKNKLYYWILVNPMSCYTYEPFKYASNLVQGEIFQGIPFILAYFIETHFFVLKGLGL